MLLMRTYSGGKVFVTVGSMVGLGVRVGGSVLTTKTAGAVAVAVAAGADVAVIVGAGVPARLLREKYHPTRRIESNNNPPPPNRSTGEKDVCVADFSSLS